jgi:hypothetical protein
MLLLSALVLMVVVFATILTGCCWLFKKPEETGLQIGFEPTLYNGIVTGVKSENTDFDLDDITLDFYYGLWRHEISKPSDEEKYEAFIAVYFIKGGYQSSLTSTFDEYKNIEGFYFVKDIPLEEFNSSTYKINAPKTPSRFGYSEQITIPREFIESLEYNYFYFTVQTVIFDQQENKYQFDSSINHYNANAVCINCKVIEDNKLQLSERKRSIMQV